MSVDDAVPVNAPDMLWTRVLDLEDEHERAKARIQVLESQLESTKNDYYAADDNAAHLDAFYRELVATVLHGDWKVPVDISPGTCTGTKTMDYAMALRKVVEAAWDLHLHAVPSPDGTGAVIPTERYAALCEALEPMNVIDASVPPIGPASPGSNG